MPVICSLQNRGTDLWMSWNNRKNKVLKTTVISDMMVVLFVFILTNVNYAL